jgi:hypothetical protein
VLNTLFSNVFNTDSSLTGVLATGTLVGFLVGIKLKSLLGGTVGLTTGLVSKKLACSNFL